MSWSLRKLWWMASMGSLLVMGACGGEEAPDASELPASIVSFSASPGSLQGPGTVHLSWETRRAIAVTLTRDGVEVDLGAALPANGGIDLRVEETSSFELTAAGATGAPATARQTVEVEAKGEPPSIGSFGGPEAVGADDDGIARITLVWSEVLRAEELVLERGATAPLTLDAGHLPDGSVEVELAETTTFTLIAKGAGGEAEASHSVRVVGPPVIEELSLDRPWVGIGEEVRVSWITEGADAVELWLDGVRVDAVEPDRVRGSFTVTPLLDAEIELRAFNELGEVRAAQRTIRVAPPVVDSFEGSADALWLGSSLSLHWTTRGGSSIHLEGEGLDEPICSGLEAADVTESSCTWTPPGPGPYRLTLSVENASGVASERWELWVGTGPRIEMFRLFPEAINQGEPLTFSWKALPDPDGALPSLELRSDRSDDVLVLEDAEGSVSLAPEGGQGPHLFTLLAETTNPASLAVEARAQAVVHGLPSVQLEATPEIFDDSQHQEVVLSWSSENAASLVLFRVADDGPVELLEVPEADRIAGVHRLVPAEASSYRIVATNALGRTSVAEVHVSLVPPEILRFDADVEEVVAGQPVELSWQVRGATEVTLDLFSKSYTREETAEPYLDVEALGGVHLPLSSECFTAGSVVLHGCALFQLEGMEFPFAGTSHRSVRVYSNGILSFDVGHLSSATAQNYAFPAPTGQSYVHLAPFWDALRWDESRYPSGNLYVLRRDEAAGRALIIQWKDVGLDALPVASLNFEVVLWENGDFEYRYGEMSPGPAPSPLANGSNATIGYQLPSRAEFDNRQTPGTVNIRGALSNRTFTYRRPPVLGSSGSFLWHPYAEQDQNHVTLRASRAGISDEETLTVLVHRRPEVSVPLRPAGAVQVGATFRIGWETLLADSVQVVDAGGAERCTATQPAAVTEGFCDLQEGTEARHVYRVRAVGALGYAVETTVEVDVYEPFGISRFEADKEILEHGDTLTLEWETYNTTSVSLFANGDWILTESGAGPGSFQTSELQGDTTFVLQAANASGLVTEEQLTVQSWKVRLDLAPSATLVRPGLPVTIVVDAASQGGAPAPLVYGTFPMQDVSSSAAFQDISTLPSVVEVGFTNANTGLAELYFPDGFEFPYFGETYRSVRVFVEGFISFSMSATSTNSNRPLPDGSSATYGRIHLAPFWDDFNLRNSGKVWAARVDLETYVIQWSSVSLGTGSSTSAEYDLNFQVVLDRSGAFEYRYGRMDPPAAPTTSCRPAGCVNEANASSATIGYQMPDGGSGWTLHHGGASSNEANPTFPGGLANRAFRYQPAQGRSEVVFHPTEQATYVYCVIVDGDPLCRSVEIAADFGLDSFTASADRVDFGGALTLAWTSHGGTSLRLVDDRGVEVFQTTDLAEIDRGSWTTSPTRNTTYTLELGAAGNSATASKPIEVIRLQLQATAPASSSPGAPIQLGWSLSKVDPALDPVLIAPLHEVQGAPFSAYDLSQDPQAEVLHGAGVATAVAPLVFEAGFLFDYLGTPMSQVQVASAGYLSFDTSSTAGSASNTALPNAATAPKRVHIAPFWDSLHTRSSGRVLAKRFDPDTYVIQWDKVSVATGSTDENEYELSFLVVLHRGGDFELRYGPMLAPPVPSASCAPSSCVNEANGSSATIGYQDPGGTLGHLLHFASNANDERPVPGGLSGRSWRFDRAGSSGSMQLAPWDTTVYVLCALDPATGDSYCAEPVEVEVQWGILAFEASPWAPLAGDEVELSWEVAGLDSLRLLAGGVELASYSGATLSSTGSFSHRPAAETTYVLEGTSLGRVISVERVVPIRTFSLELTAPGGRHFPGDELQLGWSATAHGAGDLQITTPMVVVPSGAGEPGAYQDVSQLSGATRLTTNNGNGYSNVTIPFPFPYFGTSYTQARVFVDGYLSFDLGSTSGVGGNVEFPSNTTSNRRVHLAPFWEDLFMRGSDALWTHQPDPDTFIVQWTSFNLSAGSNAPNALFDLNFQLVLRSDGSFEFRYGSMKPPQTPAPTPACFPCVAETMGSSATIGYQTVDGAFGYNVHFGGEAHRYPGGLENRAFRFAPAMAGSGKILVGAGRTYEICGVLDGFQDCAEVEVQSVADPGELMITELMIDPSGGPADQWFELRNVSQRPLDLEGFVLRSGAGTYTITGSLPIQPGDLAVFAASALPGQSPARIHGSALPLDRSSDSLSLSAGTATIAAARWSGSWTIPAGAALSLDPAYQLRGVLSNEAFERWCPAGPGSPGSLGYGCTHLRYDVDPSARGTLLDIAAVGRKVHAFSSSNQIARLEVPGFDWPFFEERVGKVWVHGSGWISFADDHPGGASAFTPGSLPRAVNVQPAGPLLAAFWSTLSCEPASFDCAFHYHYGDFGGQRALVLQWRGFRLGSSPGTVTLQAQLWENGDILVVFGDVESHDAPNSSAWNNYRGSTAWIGLEGGDRDDFVSGHLRTILDLNHRTFHFRRKP